MTESLNHYFAMLEELFMLDHEMKEEMLRINGKTGLTIRTLSTNARITLHDRARIQHKKSP